MRRMTYPRKLFGIYHERPPDSRCCEHCSVKCDCCLEAEHTAEILRVGTDKARISFGGRIIDVPLTDIRFDKEEI